MIYINVINKTPFLKVYSMIDKEISTVVNFVSYLVSNTLAEHNLVHLQLTKLKGHYAGFLIIQKYHMLCDDQFQKFVS